MIIHKTGYCDHCERSIVLCGTCGNNTCNGGYGEVMGPEPGTTMTCPDCPDAYEHDKKLWARNAEIAKLNEALRLANLKLEESRKRMLERKQRLGL